MNYENFLTCQQNRAMAKAQARYDAQEPEEDWDCEDDGHDWKRLPSEAKDGSRFMKCRKCGETKEI